MKAKLFFLLVSIIFGLNVLYAQSEKVSFSQTTFDFGTIGEKDGNVTHDFIITNNSDKPLVINSVQTSCGCTTPNYTREPINPKKSGIISVSYNPLGNSGNISKTISVTTNLEPNIVLVIKANVEKGQINPLKKYPISIQTLLFKTQPQLNFDLVNSNKSNSLNLELYNNSDSDIKVNKIFSLPDYMTVEPEIIPAKKSIQLYFSINASKIQKSGFHKGNITFSIDAKKKDFIPYNFVMEENFDKLSVIEKQEKGLINLNNNRAVFLSKDKNSYILKIANSGKSKLNIKEIQSADSNIAFSKKQISINPGRIEEVKITYPVNKLIPGTNSIIYIISDDPNHSVEKISLIVEP